MYLYDRREWSSGSIIFLIGVWALGCHFVLIPKTGSYMTGCATIVFFLAYLGDAGSMRIVLTDSRIQIYRGFCFFRRTFRYDEISGIREGSVSSMIESLGKIDRKAYKKSRYFLEWGFGSYCFRIDLKNGDRYLVLSHHVDEIIAILRKWSPGIEISK